MRPLPFVTHTPPLPSPPCKLRHAYTVRILQQGGVPMYTQPSLYGTHAPHGEYLTGRVHMHTQPPRGKVRHLRHTVGISQGGVYARTRRQAYESPHGGHRTVR
jgi:hypothetical protein